MKKLTDIKSVSALLKNDKAVKIIVAVGFALILLIMFSDILGTFGNAGNAGNTGNAVPGVLRTDDAAEYAAQLEQQLAALISEIQGASNVKVMITLESFSGSGMPQVRGAAVVCEGGDNILVKQKVVETVSKVLGISTAKVSVVN